MGNLQAGIGLLGMLGNTNTGDINATTQQQNAPLSYLQQFSQIANSLGGNGGTTTGTQGTSSNPLVSAAGGAQLGNSAMNWWNTRQNGGSAPISQSNQNAFDNFGSSNGWWGTS
jgi:hypothetical protein